MRKDRLFATTLVGFALSASSAEAASFGLLDVSNGFAHVKSASASRATFSLGGEGVAGLSGGDVASSLSLDCLATASSLQIVCDGEVTLGEESVPVSLVYDDDSQTATFGASSLPSSTGYASDDWDDTLGGWGASVAYMSFGSVVSLRRAFWNPHLIIVVFEGPDIYLDGACITCIFH